MSKTIKNIAIIPARGGSKSIPRKNIIPIGGKPLIAWSIETALQIDKIDKVLVSTNDREIQDIALEYGAEVPFLRPEEISGDYALDIETFIHALDWLEKFEKLSPSLLIHLRPTGPLRDPVKIQEAIEIMENFQDYTSLRSIERADQSPFKMWQIIENSRLAPIVEKTEITEAHSIPRQLLPTVYWQNGYVDIIRAKTIKESSSMIGNKIFPFFIENEYIDLDYPEDIKALEESMRSEKGSDSKQKKASRHAR